MNSRNHIKIFIIYLMVLPFFYAFRKTTKNNNYNTAIKVVYFEFDEEIYSQIYYQCEGFENLDNVKKHIVTNKININNLLFEISKAKLAPEFKNKIDVRRKLFIYYNTGRVDTICMAYTHVILKDGKSMQLPLEEFGWDDFYKVINKKTK